MATYRAAHKITLEAQEVRGDDLAEDAAIPIQSHGLDVLL